MLYASFIFVHGVLLHGFMIIFPGIIFNQMKRQKQIHNMSFNAHEQSYFASIGIIVSGIAMLFSTAIIGKLSRKQVEQVSFLIYIVGTSIIAFSQNKILLLLGIVIAASVLGVFFFLMITYISEICEKNRRGILISVNTTCTNLGVLFGFTLSNYLDYRTIALISVGIAVSGMIQLLFIPESAYWYLLEGRIEEARTSLAWYLPESTSSEIEMRLTEIKQSIENDENAKNGHFLELWKNIGHLKYFKPLLLGAGLNLLRGSCGRTVFIIYLMDMLEDLRIPYDLPKVISAYGTIDVTMCAIILSISRNWKRKEAIYISSAIMSLCLGVVVLYKLLRNFDIILFPPYVPVIVLFLSMAVNLTVYQSNMTIMSSEIQIPYYRAETSSLLGTLFLFHTSFFNFLYPIIRPFIRIEYILLYVIFCCMMSIAFVHFCSSETSEFEFYENEKKKNDYEILRDT